MKSYNELIQYSQYSDRLKYLQMNALVGDDTFGRLRYLNQDFYRSSEWKAIRKKVILRDKACDLAIPDLVIPSKVIVHHINPISLEDVEENSPALFDMNNLITTSFATHNSIHYGTKEKAPDVILERKPNDTKLWR